ncbi:MAG: putative adenine-specific methylase [Fimbriimonadales bacterium]|nr:MAG: putative adenine-specific methylase [Fimbriimonadales bacterium]
MTRTRSAAKVVYCNCDDPFESNFFKYFAANFNRLGLKKLITTSYDGSPIAGQQTLFPEYDEGNGKRKKPKAIAVILNGVRDEDGDGLVNVDDVEEFLKRNKAARIPLKGDPGKYPGGDFRSSECIEYLKQADIVVTNPPFSLFREYVAQLFEYEKKLLIIGNQNAITYKEIFPFIKDNMLWLGTDNGGTKWFQVRDDYDIQTESRKKVVNGVKYFSMGNIMWFTNLDHGRRHEWLQLMTMEENRKYNAKVKKSPTCYQKYDNYDAIEVPFVEAIPSDYDGVMGVPVTFLDKYNPDQFEILGCDYDVKEGLLRELAKPSWTGKVDRGYIGGKRLYSRLFIRHRQPAKGRQK